MNPSDGRKRQRGEGMALTSEYVEKYNSDDAETTVVEMKSLLDQSLSRLKSIEDRVSNLQDEVDSLKDTNSRLKNRISRLEESNSSLRTGARILSQNVEWRYSAPVPSNTYWRDDHGATEEYIDNLNEHFMENIKEITCGIRRGQCTEGIVLHIGNCEEPQTIIHTDALLPHWEELSDALERYDISCGGITDVDLSNVQLPTNVLGLLKGPFGCRLMNSFKLFGVEFSSAEEGVDLALTVLSRNRQLYSFAWEHISDLDGNAFPFSEEQSARVYNAVMEHPSLASVSLDDYLDGQRNGHNNLVALLQTKPNITTVCYRCNDVRTEGDSRIPDFLATNPPLRLLALNTNELMDADAILIAEALGANTNLTQLDIGGNNFTEVGIASLKKAVLDETSLNVLSNCNHSCQINMVHGDTSERINIWDQKANKAKKLYDLLSKRNARVVNIDCLKMEMGTGDLTRLFPDVLARVSSCHKEVRCSGRIPREAPPLSIMYGMIRKAPDNLFS